MVALHGLYHEEDGDADDEWDPGVNEGRDDPQYDCSQATCKKDTVASSEQGTDRYADKDSGKDVIDVKHAGPFYI